MQTISRRKTTSRNYQRVGQTEGGTRGRTCGEVGGAGTEFAFLCLFVRQCFSFFFCHCFSFSFAFLFLFLFFFCIFRLSFIFSSLLQPRLLNYWTPGDAHQRVLGQKRRQKRRTSQHRKGRNRGDEDAIRFESPKNLNNHAIAFRLHGHMNYNKNNCVFLLCQGRLRVRDSYHVRHPSQ